MTVKVFTPNAQGKIEFTKNELESLLNEIYTDGYTAGKNSNYYWHSPTYTTTTGTTLLNLTNTTAEMAAATDTVHFGKTVFLSREEAEKALEGGKE